MTIDGDPTRDDELTPLDISERLKRIIENDSLDVEGLYKKTKALRRDLVGKINVLINLDFSPKILLYKKLIIELLELVPLNGKWEFKVGANKVQGVELKKAFGKLVEVVEV